MIHPVALETRRTSRGQEVTFAGKYTCTASNRGGSTSMYTEVILRSSDAEKKLILSVGIPIIAIVLVLFLAFISYHR